jgi:hypothetical protein
MPASIRRYRRMVGPALLLAGVAAGCADPTRESSGIGRIEVTVTADAAAPANASYTLTLNGADARLLSGGGTVFYTGVPTGAHIVLLFGLPQSCRVEGSNPRVVQVFGDATTAVQFAVVCPKPLIGGLRIQMITTGEPVDENGYTVTVSGANPRAIGVNELEIIEGLEPGVHLVSLSGLSPQCVLQGGSPQRHVVVPGKQVLIRLRVACGSPPGSG